MARSRGPCGLPECTRAQRTHTDPLCKPHGYRRDRYGDPHGGGAIRIREGAPAERFWQKVNQHGPAPTYAPELGPCWLWTASTNGAGYGIFTVAKADKMLAHRWSYQQDKGPIPHGLHLDHLCRITLCVRPTHLEAVIQRENTLRGQSPSADHARTATCPQGHPYDNANTRWMKTPHGWGRDCRRCDAGHQARYREQNRAAINERRRARYRERNRR